MKRAAFAFVSSIAGLVVLLGFKTHTAATSASTSISTTTGTGTTPGAGSQPTPASSTSPGTGSSSTAGPTQAAGASGTKTYTGSAVNTRYGPVQVQITVTNGALTAVNAVEYPQGDPRDQQINSYAIPQLNSEAMSKHSSKIDMVSGATYTSTGYLQSLQSALDQAGL